MADLVDSWKKEFHMHFRLHVRWSVAGCGENAVPAAREIHDLAVQRCQPATGMLVSSMVVMWCSSDLFICQVKSEGAPGGRWCRRFPSVTADRPRCWAQGLHFGCLNAQRHLHRCQNQLRTQFLHQLETPHKSSDISPAADLDT